MKSKLSWIPFIPLMLAAAFFKLGQAFLPQGAVFGLSALQMDYCYLAAVALIFLFTAVFCLLDKKIGRYYLPHVNIPAGLFGLALALTLAADGSNTLFNLFSSGKIDVLKTIGSVLALLAAVVFIVFGLNKIFHVKDSKKFSLLNAFPAMFCAVRMILSFVGFTTISLRLADVPKLICYVFATLFFYYYAVALSLTKTKNAVKYCLIFGLPAVAAAIPYGVYHLVFHFDAEIVTNNFEPLEVLLIGLYVLSFLVELTIFVRDNDSIVIVKDEVPEIDLSEEKVQGFLATAVSEDESDQMEDDSVLESRDTEGFLYQEVANPGDEPIKNEEMEKEVENYLTEVSEDVSEEEEQKRRSYEERLDDIDKLILEINNQSD